jgi:hypothetical protein
VLNSRAPGADPDECSQQRQRLCLAFEQDAMKSQVSKSAMNCLVKQLPDGSENAVGADFPPIFRKLRLIMIMNHTHKR